MADGLTGSRQPIVCCKTHATYGSYYIIRYRRRRARHLLSTPCLQETPSQQSSAGVLFCRRARHACLGAYLAGQARLFTDYVLFLHLSFVVHHHNRQIFIQISFKDISF
ncbi:hypothetical protein ElyMa_002348400 [Elysia marginata]|uniref:Uncharacterized protein n=1 Tax=Elysia marginata TaxID=1093978 RepID=A0AAV4G931_9GAST|nr:hypothetical protein ElyMa_002348400 [Elysia marginata]